MAETTTFEGILTTKILDALNDYTIGHPTMICNIIREEMIKYNVKIIESINEEKFDELGYKYADSISHVNSVCNMLEDAYKAGYRKAKEE